MKECSKSIQRRLHDSNFSRRYFNGEGLDIGGKPDPLFLYTQLFPLIKNVRTWDWEDGDAQYLATVEDETYDFVHSSHCLEHLVNPKEGIRNWFRAVRPEGYLIITIPDEDLYEQGTFPSIFNHDHKWTFTIWKSSSWSKKSINILDLVKELGNNAELVRIEQLSATYRFDLPKYDQTLTPIAECGIEFIIRKRPDAEVLAGGRWQRLNEQPSQEMRLHLNQYKNDLQTLKQINAGSPPFADDKPL